jgi:hypothetical protein
MLVLPDHEATRHAAHQPSNITEAGNRILAHDRQRDMPLLSHG